MQQTIHPFYGRPTRLCNLDETIKEIKQSFYFTAIQLASDSYQLETILRHSVCLLCYQRIHVHL